MFLTRKQLGSLGSSDCIPPNSQDSIHPLDSMRVKVNARLVLEDTLPMLVEVNLVSQMRIAVSTLTQQECEVSCLVLASHSDLPASQSAVELLALAAHRCFVGQLE